jgi:hypothetical protein
MLFHVLDFVIQRKKGGETRMSAMRFLLLFSMFAFPQISYSAELDVRELVDTLKAQMKLLETTGKKDPMFRVKEAKLKVQFVISKKAEAGLKASVVTVGGEYTKEAIQELTLDLTPARPMKIDGPLSEQEKFGAYQVLKEDIDIAVRRLQDATERAEDAALKTERATKMLEWTIREKAAEKK